MVPDLPEETDMARYSGISTITTGTWADSWIDKQVKLLKDLPAYYVDNESTFVSDAMIGGLPVGPDYEEVVKLIRTSPKYHDLLWRFQMAFGVGAGKRLDHELAGG
jgi:hypothetical protein